MRPHRVAVALSVVAVLGVLGGVPGASAATAPYCDITWGSQPKILLQSSSAPVTNVRTGRHDCWDRLVVDLDGTPAPGYDARYVDAFHEGNVDSGAILPVTGGAIVRFRTFAPVDAPWHYGDHITTPSRFRSAGYRTFRDLVYGGSDGLNTELALGLRARLPFRVFILTGPGDASRLVVDVAHRW